jgi:hypothetical protein
MTKKRMEKAVSDQLDALLTGYPDTVKARIRAFAQQRDISLEDPLWQVLILLEAYPIHIEEENKRLAAIFTDNQQQLTAFQSQFMPLLDRIDRALTGAEHSLVLLRELQTESRDLSSSLQEFVRQVDLAKSAISSTNLQLVSQKEQMQYLEKALLLFRRQNGTGSGNFLWPLPRYQIYIFWGVLLSGFLQNFLLYYWLFLG